MEATGGRRLDLLFAKQTGGRGRLSAIPFLLMWGPSR